MGKGTDKLYITHSEWASSDGYSASAGSATGPQRSNGPPTRLPFTHCALTLTTHSHPVCDPVSGSIFTLTAILPYLKKHGNKHPLTGQPLKSADLIKLNFTKNDTGEYVDPVTYKVLTEHSKVVAVRRTGNVFAWDTVERLNIKPKSWKDLVSEEEFEPKGRAGLIMLQDPEGSELGAMGKVSDTKVGDDDRSGKIQKAKDAVSMARDLKNGAGANNQLSATNAMGTSGSSNGTMSASRLYNGTKALPYNAAQHTTGKAAASFTSTGLTPHTSGERALLTDEEYMLKPKRIKQKGYARIQTSLGEVNVELHPEFAPKAVWNFIQLSKKGYYKGVVFHRNIKNFMIQGGDPTRTGRGGSSIWGKNFQDEFEGPLTHDARGMMSMANKGKNTNSSQFFITYRPAKHLDRKHTIFGKVVGGTDTLTRLESAPVDDETKRPVDEIVIEDISVFVDPFEEFLKQKEAKDEAEKDREEIMRLGGTEDDKTTWTGKRLRADGTMNPPNSAPSVGKYLKATLSTGMRDPSLDTWEGSMEEPSAKKVKAKGGFGNFDNW
ncbi:Peptidyl-prolyl cis-trans isomerase cyp8 [Agyrium rufum]|nr:Peptidyl-prolyl cis-trans isomerase cyp8 [Agyrium rufum]